jgi:hypothetical protein
MIASQFALGAVRLNRLIKGKCDDGCLTVSFNENLRLRKAGRCEGVEFTLFGYSLWTVGKFENRKEKKCKYSQRFGAG